MSRQFHFRKFLFVFSGASLLFTGVAAAAVPEAESAIPPQALTGSTAQAEATPAKEEKEKEKEEKVVIGTIASQGTYGQFANVAVQTAGSSPGDEGGVLSGSVVWTKGDVCRATITNNGEKSYSVSFAIVGVDGRGSQAFKKTASANLKPKETATREVFGCKRDLNLALNVTSATAR